ncbi:hypothetical protein DM794_16925 [Paenarthrobacter ureafaciens]|nr:hypothetical protein AUT26_03435 [Arthrobacter sp. ATCC 21022]NKR12414.1 hypothetical protein [Arthrobacter sp. M5]NKR14245.1 hypothetical protein [Arthrobacter sp. M6]NWL28726.1 hypothetical protein [Paenarthrobacter ureafaciens]OEH61312.1 hypothetical protein A5N17_14470 [Arthrobacter sp. D2]OEH64258.1 hypothetical protein A5N13_12720 [Arthrobacter sp. D4]
MFPQKHQRQSIEHDNTNSPEATEPDVAVVHNAAKDMTRFLTTAATTASLPLPPRAPSALIRDDAIDGNSRVTEPRMSALAHK